MSSTLSTVPVNPSRRNLVIAGGVVAFHVAAIWALQTGLLRRAVEIVVPVAILSEIIEPPQPKVEPPPPEPKPKPPQPQPAPKKAPTPPPAPRPVATPSPAPAPNAPTGVTETQPPAPPIAAPVAQSAPPAPPAPPRVELPTSEADYLQNPKPAYPPMSKRLGEQGRVVVRVLIGVDGTARDAKVVQSSGYDRLDQAALETVLKWRYVPGKRGGVPEAMSYNVPINFVLE